MMKGIDIPVHPAAECVRLMDQDELAALAASIEARGLIEKIMLARINGASVQLIDGRNRLRACELAGIEPDFETKDFASDDEVRAFVADKGERRNLTKGQQAMRLALLYPEPEKGGRGNRQTVRKPDSFSKQRLSEARTVLAHSRDLALAVRDGTMPLDEALDVVKRARQTIETDEQQNTRLRTEAPDLADLVSEGRMKLTEATTLLSERIADLERKRRTATQLLSSFVYAWHPRTAPPSDYAARMTENVTARYWPDDGQIPLTKRNLELAAETFAAVAAQWEDK